MLLSKAPCLLLTVHFLYNELNTLQIPVDADMKDVVIAGSGKEPKIDITAPDGSKPHAEHLVDIPDVVVSMHKD